QRASARLDRARGPAPHDRPVLGPWRGGRRAAAGGVMNDSAKGNLPRIDAEEILAGIREWVEIETPSNDGAAVNRLVGVVEGQLRDVGQKTERIPGAAGFGDVLI